MTFAARVKTGDSLSSAFEAQSGFPIMYTTTLLAGERSGNLQEVLERYVSFQRVSLSFRKKLVASLIYPAVLLTLVCGLMFFMFVVVVPQFAVLYDQMGNKLPAMTMDLLAFGKFLQHNIVWILLGAAATGFGGYRFSITERGRDFIDGFRIKLPVFGKIWLKYQVALFARTLSTLLTGGLSLVPSLETAARSISSRRVAKAVMTLDHHGARGQEPGRCADPDQGLSRSGRRDDLGGRADRRLAADAQLGLGVLRGGRGHRADRVSGADRAGHSDRHGRRGRLHSHLALPAHLFAGAGGRRSGVNPWQMHAILAIPLPAGGDERAQAELLAVRYHAEFVDLKNFKIQHELLRTVPVELMFRYNFVPIEQQGDALVIAVSDPSRLMILDEIAGLLAHRIIPRVATLSQITDLLKKTEQSQRVLDEASEGLTFDVLTGDENADENISIEKLTSEEDISPIIRLVDTTIFTALERRASDIHIETYDDSVHVKYRIDGVLQEAMAPIAREHHTTILSRIKIMSELDIAERRVPQDGRFRVRYKTRLIDFRVSIMPTIHGENAVLRVLDKESMSEKFHNLTLDVVGFAEEDLKRFRALHSRALRHGAGHRADRLGQDDDALCRAQRDQERRRQDHHHRGPGRVPDSRHHADSRQRERRG